MQNLTLKDFTNYKFLSSLKFSPKGSSCAFIVHTVDLEENKYLSNIYILDEANEPIKLTSFDEEKSFVWKDEETIVFSSLRDPKDKELSEKGQPLTCLYEIDIKGGEANKFHTLHLNVTSIKYIDDDNIFLTSTFDPNVEDFKSMDEAEKEIAFAKIKEEKDYEVVDEIPFWSNGSGWNNKKREKLYHYNFSEERLTSITDDFTEVESYKLNEDKSLMVIITNSYTDKMQTKSELYIYDMEDGRLEKISPYKEFNYSYADFLGEEIIFVGTDMKDFGINQNPQFYICNIDGYAAEQISRNEFDYATNNSVGSDCRYGSYSTMTLDQGYLYFVTTEGDSSFINRINGEGKIEKLTNKKGSIDGLDVFNGVVKFIGLRSLKLQELYILKNRNEIQLTHFNQWVMTDRKLSIPEKLTFKTKEEVLIEGWVMKPVGYVEGKTYPAILNIHGGPKTVYGEVFVHEMQSWANEGYVVFFCNPRGSDGRGNAFADIRGKYGTIDYEDIMNFTDLVLEKYTFIDKKRIGVTGGSYGGFMTNWIIGHTHRFKAAASQRSISNWISKFGTTDIGYYFVDDQIAATPWNDMDKLWEHSPMKYADQVTTPTLFIHSEEDYRCWIAEGIQMFTSLKYHGVESKLVMFRGENHDLSRSGKPKHRVRRLEEITNWFNHYLK